MHDKKRQVAIMGFSHNTMPTSNLVKGMPMLTILLVLILALSVIVTEHPFSLRTRPALVAQVRGSPSTCYKLKSHVKQYSPI